MNGRGSRQLRNFLRAIRAGVDVASAAETCGIGAGEARLHADAEAAGEYADIDISEPTIGHNSGETSMSDVIAVNELRQHIEAIERLEEERKGLSDDIKDRYALAKSTGFDPKTMRKVVRLRKMERNAREEAAALLGTYCNALGVQGAFDP